MADEDCDPVFERISRCLTTPTISGHPAPLKIGVSPLVAISSDTPQLPTKRQASDVLNELRRTVEREDALRELRTRTRHEEQVDEAAAELEDLLESPICFPRTPKPVTKKVTIRRPQAKPPTAKKQPQEPVQKLPQTVPALSADRITYKEWMRSRRFYK